MVRYIGDGSDHFLHSKEGMTQGGPLAMITYDIGVLPIIRELRDAHPRVTWPWCADNSGAGGTSQQVQAHFLDLQARGPAWSYYTEPTKSILVVAPGNVARAEEHLRGLGIGGVTGHRYLGRFIGDAVTERELLKEKVQG